MNWQWIVGIAVAVALGMGIFQMCSRHAHAAPSALPPSALQLSTAARRHVWEWKDRRPARDHVRCYVPFPRRPEALINLTCELPALP